jgi:Domain of unknown function (DUF4178)
MIPPLAPGILRGLMDPQEKFRLLAAVSLLDGRLLPVEEKVLMQAGARLGVEPSRARATLDELRAGGAAGDVAPPSDPRERRELFKDMVDLVVADGVVSPQEQGCLTSLSRAFGLSSTRVDSMVQEALQRVLRQAPTSAIGGHTKQTSATGGFGTRARRSGEASCPSCGAGVEFKNARSVAAVCEYCDTTVAREDGAGDLRDLGKVSHIAEDASPIQIGATGKAFDVEFEVIGRLQVEHDAGYWNEWFLEWADGRTGWLGEAQGQYSVTFPVEGEGEQRMDVPSFAELSLGQRVFLGNKRFQVTDKRVAVATGTQGETPFVVEQGYQLPYVDLRCSTNSFATIDYSEDEPLVFMGKVLGWRDLQLRNFRTFAGWDA